MLSSCHICPSPRPGRLECTKSLLRRLWSTHTVRQRWHKTCLPPNRFCLPCQCASWRKTCRETQRTSVMRYTKGRIESLISTNRSYSYHGRSKPRRKASPPRTLQAIPPTLVLYTSRLLRACRIRGRSCAERSLGGIRSITWTSSNSFHTTMAISGESDDWRYRASFTRW